MPKTKSTDDRSKNPLSVELDDEQIAALQFIPDNLHPGLKCLAPVLETIRKAYEGVLPPHKRAVPTRQATEFKRTTAAARLLGVDYKEDNSSYVFNLKTEHLQEPGKLSEHFASVIKDLKSSDYVSARHDESFCRTVLDLIIIDRLSHLEDRDAYHRLQVSAEVPVSIRVKDTYGNDEIIKGRADWALSYGADKNDTGAVLLVVEAKPYESATVGMPQLLVYMAAVHEERRTRNNRSVFGMVSDSKDFRFAFLSEEKKLFVSMPFVWFAQQSTIIAYIDMMLINAIESSPHTTPQKINNTTILKNPKFLRKQWEFGDESNDQPVEDEDMDDGDEGSGGDDMIDIVNIGTTRDNFAGKPVKELQYSAYESLALKTMLNIAQSIKAKHGLTAISMLHRLGVVPIGQESILIAVSSPHREAAWRASEEALEECKAKVEIWKLEEFGGDEGGVWRANRDGAIGVPIHHQE
ncbi:Molybdopterin synthase catalytic subunit [Xylographa bjoerkii]|nr:Molybdopterin synthase catalytic subunit [Xylographa bjoerkii]